MWWLMMMAGEWKQRQHIPLYDQVEREELQCCRHSRYLTYCLQIHANLPQRAFGRQQQWRWPTITGKKELLRHILYTKGPHTTLSVCMMQTHDGTLTKAFTLFHNQHKQIVFLSHRITTAPALHHTVLWQHFNIYYAIRFFRKND